MRARLGGADAAQQLLRDRDRGRRHAELGQAEADQQRQQRRDRRPSRRRRPPGSDGGAPRAPPSGSSGGSPGAAARRAATPGRRCDRPPGRYWIRSLVPMLKKSASAASRSAVSAADGTSIMTPIGTSGTANAARAQRVGGPRARRLRAARSSFTPDTNGNMIRSGPWRAARSSARSCAWKISSSARLSRMPRSPSGARAPSTPACSIRQLRFADVERPHGHAAAAGALDQPPVGGDTATPRRARPVRRRRAGTPTGTARCPRRRARAPAPHRPALRCWPRAGWRRRPAVTAGSAPVLVERLLVGLAAAAPGGDLRQRLLVGIDDDLAGRAVDGDVRARRDHRAGVVQAGNGRNVQRSRQDGGVIGPAAGVGDERREHRPVQLRDHRRRDFVGDQHHRSVEALERDRPDRRPRAGSCRAGRRRRRRPPCARAGRRPRRGRRTAEICSQRALQRRLGVQPLVADDRRGALDQHRVVEHQQLRVEQVGVVGAGRVGDPRLDVLDLLARSRPRLLQPLELARRPAPSGTRKRSSRVLRFSTSARPMPMPGETPSPFRCMVPRRSRARPARAASRSRRFRRRRRR